jgi:chaperone required for assembly of F1-ATPase
MKRFYQNVAVVADPTGAGFGIELDGKTLRSPAKAPLVMPTRALADAVALEWAEQGDEVAPATMPMMRIVSTAIDLVADRRDQICAETVKFAETDLLCYRADEPDALVHRQAAGWQPLVDWATLTFDAPFQIASGVMPVRQPVEVGQAVTTAVMAHDDFRLTALALATAACGSVILGLALLAGRIDGLAAFELSQLDETFQIEKWGEDAEAAKRRANLKADILAVDRFLRLL